MWSMWWCSPRSDSLPLPLALGYKVQNLDKNKYHSNVIHWKQFLAAGKDESIAAEPYDPEHACVAGAHRRHHWLPRRA